MTGQATGQDIPVPVSSALTTGDLLAERYRLVGPVAFGAGTTRWRAVDEVLARSVAVLVLDPQHTAPGAGAGRSAPGASPAEAFVRAAVAAGRVGSAGVARIYDTADLTDGSGTPVWVVGEWVDGVPLSVLLADGPLPPVRALTIATRAARALSAAHEAGVPHRRLDPGNVFVGDDDAVTLSDLAVAAALLGPEPDLPPAEGDARALGALLYAGLTGRWPFGGRSGVPPAPYRNARLCTPHQVRASVPRSLDTLTMRVLDPERYAAAEPCRTPAAVATALADAALAEWPLAAGGAPAGGARVPPARATGGAVPRPTVAPGRREGRLVRIALPLALVAAAAIGGWLAGLAIGAESTAGQQYPSLPPATGEEQDGASTAAGDTRVTVAHISDFDPLGGDRRENPDLAAAAVDDDPASAWETVRYTTTDLGRLKPGVGLLVDLGETLPINAVAVTVGDGATSVQLRAADTSAHTAPGSIASYRVVATSSGAGTLRLVPDEPDTARFWVVWITRLPPVESGYRAHVADLAFLR